MMHKCKIVLAAFVAGALLSSGGSNASMGIASLTSFSNGINPPPLTLDTSDVFQTSVESAETPFSMTPFLDSQTVDLSINPTGHFSAYSDFAVGKSSLAVLHEQSAPALGKYLSPPKLAEPWDFMQRIVAGSDFWDAVGNMFDVTDDERPWSDTTAVHILAPTGNPFVPFATIAYEVDSIDVYDRMGMGGGAQISLGKNTTLGADLIYFGDRLNDTTAHETRAMARLEIQF